MAKPIKFKAKFPKIKLVNKCVYCGKIIQYGFICSSCERKNKFRW